jgi:hypothetical protein
MVTVEVDNAGVALLTFNNPDKVVQFSSFPYGAI